MRTENILKRTFSNTTGSGEPGNYPVRARDLLKPDVKRPVSDSVLNSSGVIRTTGLN